MILTKPSQIHDAIAVRLFTFEHTNLTREISKYAMVWAGRRNIPIAIEEWHDKAFIILPSEFAPYLNWHNIVLSGPLLRDVLDTSLDMIQDFGWRSVKNHITKFTKDERQWLLYHAPDHFEWLTE